MKKISESKKLATVSNYFVHIGFAFMLLVTSHHIVNKYHDWGGDFSLYISQARALIDHNLEQILKINGYGVKNSTYPYYSPVLALWGWPILLALPVKVVGYNYVWYKFYVMCFFIGIVSLSFALLKKKIGVIPGLLISLCLGLNPILIFHTQSILAGFPYLFFLLLSILLYEYLEQRAGVKIWMSILAAFVFFFTSIIRSEGVLLIGAATIVFILGYIKSGYNKLYFKKNSWFLILGLAFFVYHTIYSIIFPTTPTSHIEHFKLVNLNTILSNVMNCVNSISHCLSSYLGFLFTSLSIPLVLVGLYTRRKKDVLIVIYLIMHLTLLIIWPHHEPRYIYMLIPFYFYFLYVGLLSLKMKIKFKDFKISFAVVSLIILSSLLSIDYYKNIISKSWKSKIIEGPETKHATDMFSFINANTSMNDVIVFFKPRVMSLYTGRKSLIVHNEVSKIKEKGNYVVIHKGMGDNLQLSTLINSHPDWLNMKYENNQFLVYKVEL